MDEPTAAPADTERAWSLFAAGALTEAIAAARAVVAVHADDWSATAALGFFLFKAGELAQAREVLLPARERAPHFAPLHWYSGYVLEQAGEREAAALAFEQACTVNPLLHEAAFALAWVLHGLGHDAQALARARQALAAERTPPRLQQVAWLLQHQGHVQEATGLWREAIGTLAHDAPQQPVMHLHLVQCLSRAGHTSTAHAELRAARLSWPEDALLFAEELAYHRTRGDLSAASHIAREWLRLQPGEASDWHVLGVLLQEMGDLEGADAAFLEVQQRDLGNTDALVRRAQIQYGWKHHEGARWLLGLALEREPRHPAALGLLAQALLEEGDHAAVRRLLVPVLRGLQAQHGDLWRLLALSHARAGRRRRAASLLRHVTAQLPDNIEAWRSQGWLALERGDTDEAVAAAQALLSLVPDDVAAQVQASFIFLSAGLVGDAQRWAEHAAAHAPSLAEAWRALSHVRLHQRRAGEAQAAIEEALRLAPDNVDCLRQWGAVNLALHRNGQAQLVLLRALEIAPDDPALYLELAQVQAAAGQLDDAVQSMDALLAQRPGWFPALLARARYLVEAGHGQALAACEQLLRSDRYSAQAVRVVLRLIALGEDAGRRLLLLIPADLLRDQWQAALAQAVHTQGQACLHRLARVACEELDPDPWLQAAALYAASLSAHSDPATLARQARDAYRGLKLRSGTAGLPMPQRPAAADGRPRIAYIAGQLHDALLAPVLAAHDPGRAQVFVYTNHPVRNLPAYIHVQPLEPQTLAASCAANRIDVVIDTGGLHPVEAQFEVLRACAQRIAPVQVAWLGGWGSAGGLFDALLADAVSVPLAHTVHHAEEVARLEGGQWCWAPPAAAPEPGPPPLLAAKGATFGVTSRSLRLDADCLDTFARVVAAVPGSAIRFIGEIAGDWPLRRDVLRRMRAVGVTPDRVFFDPFVPHAEYLLWCRRIDVVLDSFPGNGGLSLLDPLWMGVPVVTLAGGWAGARQGASLLHALGLEEWVAETREAFVGRAAALAHDVQGLARLRAGLRARVAASPLVDGRRVAAQIEALCRRWAREASSEGAAPHAKDRLREHARRMLGQWLQQPRTIDLPAPDGPPELSVIVVLYNQAGLSLRTLQALADQQGVRFETVVVDNASSDHTPQLLERLRGAQILRNAGNLGFLRAARQGAQAARGRYLAFLNSDAILQEGALHETLRLMRANPGIGALGARVVLTTGGLQEAGNLLFDDGSAGGIGRGEDAFHHGALAARDTDYVSGVFLVTPAPVWRMLDGFDEAFAPAYYEDTDYCLRVWQAGLRVVYAPSVLLEHLEWGSATGSSATELMERNRQLFSERHQWLLRHRPRPGALPLAGDRWRSPDDEPRRPRVLFIDNEVPYSYKGGGLPRARWMLHALDGWPVTLFPLWVQHDHVHRVYDSLPASVEVALGHHFEGLEAFLEQRRGLYDVMLVSRPPNLERLQPLRQRRPDLFYGMSLVYDAEALFALREIAMAGVQGRPLSSQAQRERLAREMALADGASDVLVVSQRDARHFEAAGHRTHVLSHGIALRREAPGPGPRTGLLFVGALHPDTPNEDGLLWFIQEVMPLLHARLGRAPVLSVVGVCLSARVAALAGENVRILGPQAALEPHYDAARVFIAPVRFAGGVPAKVIEAAAAGIPVVASALLVRQLEWRDGTDVLGARDARTFAQAVARLCLDDAAWQRQQHAAWQQCALRYDPEVFASTLRRVLESAAST
ncbi:glycosyltransferase [Acidovorax sp. sic0104]|uniref:glycosyltransferase n=1 Tax=Acidovorax sp. sic0104 TaxID=2854784 RepID=UPI001C43EDFA|nr:glycosyltransferase [Acidovorax sp. sic0104]MBV7540375.1 glycosyltransferase [Acidovorax sp. sic0104]